MARADLERPWLDGALVAAIERVRDHADTRAAQQDLKAEGMRPTTDRERWLQGRRVGQAKAYREIVQLLGAILEGAEDPT